MSTLKSGKYCIWTVRPEGNDHGSAYNEVALAFQAGFRELGFDAPIVDRHELIQGRAVVLGSSLLPITREARVPDDAILFNFEQIFESSPWLTDEYMALLRAHTVWDYSPLNIERLKAMGVSKIYRCGVGYESELSRIEPQEQDIDVLIYGIDSPRRQAVVEQLEARGMNALFLRGVFGDERDKIIARSKIVLNVHHYEAHIFEIVRVSYLLANSRFVISEPGADTALEAPFLDAVDFAPFSDLVERCAYYLDNPTERDIIAKRGYEIFKAMPQHEFIQSALNEIQ